MMLLLNLFVVYVEKEISIACRTANGLHKDRYIVERGTTSVLRTADNTWTMTAWVGGLRSRHPLRSVSQLTYRVEYFVLSRVL